MPTQLWMLRSMPIHSMGHDCVWGRSGRVAEQISTASRCYRRQLLVPCIYSRCGITRARDRLLVINRWWRERSLPRPGESDSRKTLAASTAGSHLSDTTARLQMRAHVNTAVRARPWRCDSFPLVAYKDWYRSQPFGGGPACLPANSRSPWPGQ